MQLVISLHLFRTKCWRGEPAASSQCTWAGSAIAWCQANWSNAYEASWFSFESLFKSDNLMAPITVSCGQFPLPPPRRLTGKAEIYSCGVTTPMGYCSLLLWVSWLAALQMNLPNRGEICLVSGVHALLGALCTCDKYMCKLLGPCFNVHCDPYMLSAGPKEWQYSRFSNI